VTTSAYFLFPKSEPVTQVTTVSSPRLIYVVKQLELAVRARLDTICRENGVTTTQYTALSVLFVKPGMSSAQLAVRSFMKPQSAHQTVRELEAKGYIHRVPDESNRRILRIHLTTKGRVLLQSCNRAVDQLEQQMFNDFQVSESLELQQLLSRCLRNLSPSS
jgi:DNA-binding MarR family transcriptional regulator